MFVFQKDTAQVHDQETESLARTLLVQSLNSPFFPPLIGAEPGRTKEESRIICMRMIRMNQSKNRRKQARLIKQYRDIFFPIFRKVRPSFFRVLQRMTLVLNVTNLKYGKYDMTSKKKNNNKRLIDRAK